MPEKGLSKHYEGTPTDIVLQRTKNLDALKLGNTYEAALRILEVVTGTGMGQAQGVRNCLRLPLGEDCFNVAMDKWKTFGENLEVMKEITLSTGIEK